MNTLDHAIEKMSILSSDEMGQMHGGFVSSDDTLVSIEQGLNVNVNVNVNKGSRCRCACKE